MAIVPIGPGSCPTCGGRVESDGEAVVCSGGHSFSLVELMHERGDAVLQAL